MHVCYLGHAINSSILYLRLVHIHIIDFQNMLYIIYFAVVRLMFPTQSGYLFHYSSLIHVVGCLAQLAMNLFLAP